MQYRPHIKEDHARGKARLRACIATCLFAPVATGSYFSDRFKPEQIVTTREIYVKLPEDYVYMSNIKIMK